MADVLAFIILFYSLFPKSAARGWHEWKNKFNKELKKLNKQEQNK